MKNLNALGIGFFALGLASLTPHSSLADPRSLAVGTRPESVTRGFGGKLYVTVMNGTKEGDGVVRVVDGENVADFATGLDEPKGIVFTGKVLVTSDVLRVWRIDKTGAKTVLAEAQDFPKPISYLNDVGLEPGGKAVYVVDMGANTRMRDTAGALWPLDSPQAAELPAIGRVYRIGVEGKDAGKVTLIMDASPEMPCPNGVTSPRKGQILVAEFFKGNILQIEKGKATIVTTGLRGADAVEQDRKGRIYVSSWTQGKVWRLDRGRDANVTETVMVEGLQSAADFFLDEKGKTLIVPDMKAGTINFVPLR